MLPLFSGARVPYRNIEDKRASVRRAHAKLRQRLIDLKGGRCKECKREDSYLEIHHTKEDGKNHLRRKSRYRWMRYLLTHRTEYDLLCRHPCHRRVTMRYVRSYGKGGKRAR